MATDPTDPLPDIEAAIKEEVAGMNREKRPRPPVRFSTEPSGYGLPRPENAVEAAITQAQPEPPTLPEILDLMVDRIAASEDRITAHLMQIKRVLGIRS